MYEDEKAICVAKIKTEGQLINSGETECSQASQRGKRGGGTGYVVFITRKAAKSQWETGQVQYINVQVKGLLCTLLGVALATDSS